MHMINRRHFVHMTALSAALGASGVSAQTPLFKQAKVVVGFPPGGSTDNAARLLAEELRGTYAEATIVENKTGSAGRIAVESVLREPADGSVIMVQPDPVIVQQPHVDPKGSRYKLEDLLPVASITSMEQALAVGPMVPASVRTLRDFVAWAKANPSLANFGSPAPNSTQEFLLKMGLRSQGVTLNHVPYRGSGPGILEMVGGQLPAMMTAVGDFLPHLGTGKVRVLGTSGARRSRYTPDAPTFKEQGFDGMEHTERLGVWLKAGVPAAAADRLHAEVQRALKKPSVAEFFAKVGMDVDPMSRQAFAKSARDSNAAWIERIRVSGFKPE